MKRPVLIGAVLLCLAFPVGTRGRETTGTRDDACYRGPELAERFSLSVSFRGFGPVDLFYSNPGMEPGREAGDVLSRDGKNRRRHLTAALETFGANILVWAFDRYVMKEDWARIDLDSICRNLQSGFVWDTDKFSTNFFSHPYHGSLYFNAARSNGMEFWTSALYTLAGSMMWELFMERNRPSINDLVMTTSGGITLGEILFRLSSLVTGDADSGNAGLFREIAGWIVNPARGFNRMLHGDTGGYAAGSATSSLRGVLIWSGNIVSRSPELRQVDKSTVSELYLVYGSPFDSGRPRRPYDYFTLAGSFWRGPEKTSISVSARSLLFGRNLSRGLRWRYLVGLFQHYDYLNFESIEIGGTSLCPGIISSFQLSERVTATASLHLGWLMLGASGNEYVLEDLRDYNYGAGLTTKLDTILDFHRFGALSLRWSNFLIRTLKGVAGVERLDLLKTWYSLPVWKSLNLGIDYSIYRRESDFEDFQDIRRRYYEARLFIALRF